MNISQQIEQYLATQPALKRGDMAELHKRILKISPDCKLWFLDGKNSEGKTVSNPNIGYGVLTKKYADGKTSEFYQVGMSANTTGISIYVMGLDDKKHLAGTYGKDLGKASVTGYCIKFKALKDIDLKVLESAIADGFKQTGV